MPTKTTIDANAPILMQWIVSSPERLNKEAEPGRHPLPNTQTFPHRQRLVNMAKVEPDRLICLYYLGDTLNEEQNQQMQDLEKLAPNIRAIDFNKLDWSEYDFEFDTNRLTSDLDSGKKMRMTEYLKLQNTDNRMGFRLDMMRILMLLKAGDGLIESKKVKLEEISNSKSVIYFDFDAKIEGKIGELNAPLGILASRTKGVVFSSKYKYENGAIAVNSSSHPVIIKTYDQIKASLTETKPVLYKKLRSIIAPYLNNKNEFDKESQKKLLDSIKNLQKETDQYSSVVHFDNPKKRNKKLIDSLINKFKDAKNTQKFLDVAENAMSWPDSFFLNAGQKQVVYFFFRDNLEKFALQNINKILIKIMRAQRKKLYNKETKLDKILEEKICLNTAIEKNGSQFSIQEGNTSWECYPYTKRSMYEVPELEIKNIVSTNLKDVKQEQDKGYCRF